MILISILSLFEIFIHQGFQYLFFFVVVVVKPAVKKPVKSGEFCEVCQLVMNYLKAELEANGTEQAIEALLDKICTRLPDSYSSQVHIYFFYIKQSDKNTFCEI